MAITSEIIGKLGGGVEEVPVSGTASGSSGSSAVITTINIPAGETWLVAAIGQKPQEAPSIQASQSFILGM